MSDLKREYVRCPWCNVDGDDELYACIETSVKEIGDRWFHCWCCEAKMPEAFIHMIHRPKKWMLTPEQSQAFIDNCINPPEPSQQLVDLISTYRLTRKP